MKKLITVVVVLVVICLAVLFAAGYFLGNVPVISNILGTNEAEDLGVEISLDNAYDGLEALNKPTTYDDLEAIVANPGSYTNVKATVTDDEISSLLALADIPDLPVKLTQVKFNSDGTLESSGVLDTALLVPFLEGNGVSCEAIEKITSYVKLQGQVNYYVKAACDISNNNVDLDVSSLQIGKIEVPADIVQGNSAALGSYIGRALSSSGYDVRKMEISNGKVELDADRPLGSIQPWLKLVQQTDTE